MRNVYVTENVCRIHTPIIISSFMTYHPIRSNSNTRWVPLVEEELLTLPVRMSVPQVFSEVRVVYSVLTTIVCLLVLCLLVFTLSLLLIFHPYCILKTLGVDWHTSLNWVVHLISPAEQPECSFKGMVSYIGRNVPMISIKAQVLHSKS